MVNLYYRLIVAKRKTIDDVPASLQESVLALLEERGYDGYGEQIE